APAEGVAAAGGERALEAGDGDERAARKGGVPGDQVVERGEDVGGAGVGGVAAAGLAVQAVAGGAAADRLVGPLERLRGRHAGGGEDVVVEEGAPALARGALDDARE